MPLLRSFSLIVPFFLVMVLNAHAQELHIKNWKRKKVDITVKSGSLVSLWVRQKDDSTGLEQRIYGYITGVTKDEIIVAPLRITLLRGYSRRYEREAKDTGVIEEMRIPVSLVTSVMMVDKKKKDRPVLEMTGTIAFSAIFLAAPLISVNHIKGTVDTRLYGWTVLGSCVIIPVSAAIIAAVFDNEKLYLVYPNAPETPYRSNYYLMITQ